MKKKRNKAYLKALAVGVVLAILGTFIQLPYYVTKPGMATELAPIIEVENGYQDEGEFMLTTIRMGQANIFSYGLAKLQKYHEILPINHVRRDNESDEEYTNRQLFYMEDSQESAITVAYQHANKPVTVKNNGIYIMGIVEGMPAEKELKAGDRIFEVDGHQIEEHTEFMEYVAGKKENEIIKISVERNGEEKTVSVPLAPFPNNPDKIGIGIELITDIEVVTDPKIEINTKKIGGPSAGLMFTLEIYNQLTEKDLTHGLRIAGTGTINIDGQVGPIGGIGQKIVAANNSDVDIFFAPNENGAADSDYRQALATAKDIKSDMKIVPVDTFEDALHYLENLDKNK
ncbi:SepM family pheromone-processing serine protease [Fredinandcohnia sp. QZ13]|uniref:SepM family pheromone-processing serine protease n=1 Tax=Fredinandcohnia sp. QZ13 TaxID=3073144 RepID=UPI002853485B|nr:SepM family pheromone-processing serine protease [Fredinandcohnia sp. QZ13]MDR4886612.1 SepM family pheromone-processing serine protease [Fredinandcohnia sp. QZ13]